MHNVETIRVNSPIEANPYSAHPSVSDTVTGYVRIEPPFKGSKELYDNLSETEGVRFTPLVSSNEAMVLDYYRDESRADEFEAEAPRERLVGATQKLLNYAGMLALPAFDEITQTRDSL